ncbi:MAG: pseudaminic acid cytidylyltransferase [Trueperaceae bacterium]
MNLAVIPARGGSKRIPRKNIKSLHGKPMIAYTIEAALQSEIFERVVVSTDDVEIAEMSKQYGAEVPFVREAALADDHTPASLVTLDALGKLEAQGSSYTYVSQLMPNCPLRSAEDIQKSFKQFQHTNADTQLSVNRFGWLNPWWAFKIEQHHKLSPLFPEAFTTRSQDLATLYALTGALWWAKSDVLKREKTFHVETRTGFELSWQHALDIDDEEDWKMAEVLLELAKKL